jgi:hypothetical protein
MEWILKKLGGYFGKTVTIDEYNRITNENKRERDYHDLIRLMDGAAKKRSVTCKPDELSQECPMAMVIDQMYDPDPRRTTSGTAAYRMFTIIGSDGQIINLQGYDLSQNVKITVRHTDGKMDLEEVDPSEAMKRIRREAGYTH